MSRALYAANPLPLETISSNDGFNYEARLNVTDLTTAVNATAQAFTLMPIPKGAQVQVKIDLKVPFKDVSDAAFNDSAITVGDGSSANSLLTTTQLNENGTEVLFKTGTLSAAYTADDNVIVTFNSMTAKKLSDLDIGLVYFLIKLVYPRELLNLQTDTSVE